MIAVDGKRLNDADEVLGPASIEKALKARALSRRAQALLAAAGEDVPERRWYVLTVDAGCDNLVDNALANAGVERWMAALEMKPRRRGGRRFQLWQPIVAPALPGYLFVRVFWTPAVSNGLKGVDGVDGVIGGWERPAPLKDKEVEKLRVRVEKDPKFIELLTNALREGDEVRVDDGPFASFGGIVRLLTGASRVKVEVDIFGRAVKVDLDLAQISKVE